MFAGFSPNAILSSQFVATQLSFVGPIDTLTASAAAYSTRRLRSAYTGPAVRVRRSSNNAEADIGFATAQQTRTNLATVPANARGSFDSNGLTQSIVGTGTEFGQTYVDVRVTGTMSGATNSGRILTYRHSPASSFDPAVHAAATPGLTYTSSVGVRIVGGTLPAGAFGRPETVFRDAGGGFLTSSAPNTLVLSTSSVERGVASGVAPASAAYVQHGFFLSGGTVGLVVDLTLRFYAPNVEVGVTQNAKPLTTRNTPEVVAEIGDLDMDALAAHVGGSSGNVTTWYDQSGNGRDATQATAGNQPRIVNAGVVDAAGGFPALDFASAATHTLATADFLGIEYTAHAVFMARDTAADKIVVARANSVTTAIDLNAAEAVLARHGDATTTLTLNEPVIADRLDPNVTVVTAWLSNAIREARINTLLSGTDTDLGDVASASQALTISANTASAFDGRIAEVIVWQADIRGADFDAVHDAAVTRWGAP